MKKEEVNYNFNLLKSPCISFLEVCLCKNRRVPKIPLNNEGILSPFHCNSIAEMICSINGHYNYCGVFNLNHIIAGGAFYEVLKLLRFSAQN